VYIWEEVEERGLREDSYRCSKKTPEAPHISLNLTA